MRLILRITQIVLLIFAGCVKIPEDEAYCLIDETPSLNCSIEEALASGSYVSGDFPPEKWWEMFQDSQLNDLIQSALCSNPTLQVAEERVQRAQQEATVMRSRLFPNIGFNVGVDFRYFGKDDFFRAFNVNFPDIVTKYMIDLDFEYEFDFWNQNRNNYRAALGDIKVETAEYEAAKLVLTTSVAAVYFKLQALIQKLGILEKERDNFVKLFELTLLRQKNALDDQFDYLASEEHLYLINQNVIVAQEQIKLNQHMLKRLLGQGPDASVEIQLQFPSSLEDFPLPSQISSDLLARRPDLMAMIWRVERAAYLVGVAKADFYPRIDLNALGGLGSVFLNTLFSNRNWASTVFPALHLPLFTAGRIRANLKASEAEFRKSVYAYNNSLLDAVREVADQIVVLQKRDEEVQIETSVVRNRIQNLNLITLRYQNSLENLLKVLNTQNDVLQEQFRQIGLQYEKITSAIGLIKSLGGGYHNEEVLFE